MTTWEIERQGQVEGGVGYDAVQALIKNGTLTRSTPIRRAGTATWVAVSQSEFAPLLQAVEVFSIEQGVPEVGKTAGQKLHSIFLICFGLIVAIGLVAWVVGTLDASTTSARLLGGDALRFSCALLVCLIIAVALSTTMLVSRLTNLTEVLRAAEVIKLRELAEIRRAIGDR